jgi:hypothetical protein
MCIFIYIYIYIYAYVYIYMYIYICGSSYFCRSVRSFFSLYIHNRDINTSTCIYLLMIIIYISTVSEAPTLLSATSKVNTPVNSAGQKGSQLSNYALKGYQPKVIFSFEAILKSFLRLIPFHVVEIWVPVQLEGGSTVLLYGESLFIHLLFVYFFSVLTSFWLVRIFRVEN